MGGGGDGDWGMLDFIDIFYLLLYNDGVNIDNNGGGDNNCGNMWLVNDFIGMWGGF